MRRSTTHHLIAAILTIVAFVLAPQAARGARAQASHAAGATGASVLYQANWSAGAAGWQMAPGFGVAQGMLTFDGAGDDGVFAPFALHGLQRFAIEATIKVGTPIRPKQASFDLFARRSSADQRSGLYAGYDAFAGESTAANVADLSWPAGKQFDYVPGAALQLDAAFHTYRLEVQGNAYRFLRDGQPLIPWTIVQLPNAEDRIGITFTYIPATVKDFVVYALPAATERTGADTAAILDHAISPTDVPAPPTSTICRDNARYASDSGVDLATVQDTSRIYGCVENFEDNDTYVQESINLHADAAGARAAFALFSRRSRQATPKPTAYQDISAAYPRIGDRRFIFIYQYLYQGQLSRVARVLFQRGPYYIVIIVGSSKLNVVTSAIAIAQGADALVRGPLPTITAGNKGIYSAGQYTSTVRQGVPFTVYIDLTVANAGTLTPSGALTLLENGKQIYSGPMQQGAYSDGKPIFHATLTLGADTPPGQITARVSLRLGAATSSNAITFTLAAAS